MALRIVADSLDELPEGLRESAQANGNGFAVNQLPEGWEVDDLSAIRRTMARVKSELGESKATVAELKDKVGAFEGIPADKVQDAMDALQKLEAGQLRGSREFDEWKATAERKHRDEAQSWRTKHDDLERSWLDSWLDEQIATACSQTGASRSVAVLKAYLRPSVKVERGEDGKPKYTLLDEDGISSLASNKKGSVGESMGLVEKLELLRGAPETRGLFDASASGGAGSSSQTGGAGQAAGKGIDITSVSAESLIERGLQSQGT